MLGSVYPCVKEYIIPTALPFERSYTIMYINFTRPPIREGKDDIQHTTFFSLTNIILDD